MSDRARASERASERTSERANVGITFERHYRRENAGNCAAVRARGRTKTTYSRHRYFSAKYATERSRPFEGQTAVVVRARGGRAAMDDGINFRARTSVAGRRCNEFCRFTEQTRAPAPSPAGIAGKKRALVLERSDRRNIRRRCYYATHSAARQRYVRFLPRSHLPSPPPSP